MMRPLLAFVLLTTLGCGSDAQSIVDADYVRLLGADDAHVYYAMDDGEAPGIYRVDLATDEAQQLLPMPVDADLRATLAGDQLYVHAGTDLWQIPAAGGKAFVIAERLYDVEALAADATTVYLAGNSGIRALALDGDAITMIDDSGPAGRDGAYRRSGFMLAGRRLVWQGEGRDGLLAFDLDTGRRSTLFAIPEASSFDGTRGTLHTAEPVGMLRDSGAIMFLYRDLVIDGTDSELDGAALYQATVDADGVHVNLIAANLISATVHDYQAWGVRADGVVVRIWNGDVIATGLTLDLDQVDKLDLHLVVTRNHLLRDQAASSIDAFALPAE